MTTSLTGPKRTLWAAGWLLIEALLPLYAHAEWFVERTALMGTEVRIELWHEDRATAEKVIAAAVAEIKRLDTTMSIFDNTSELSLINRTAYEKPVRINDEFFFLIHRALHYSRLSNGAFDITVAPVSMLYDFRKKIHPTREALDFILPSVGFDKLLLSETDHTLKFLKKNMAVDLGGIAKGYAVDRCIALLRQHDIQFAMVTAGGDSRILGDRRGRPWNVGIKHPRIPRTMAAILPLSDTAISTSGDYERYFIENNIRYHHIINPKTGDSARQLQSVTVVGPEAVDTDALSTTVFVLGLEEGLRLIESLPDTDAVIIDRNGRIHYSSGFRETGQSPPSP